MENYLNLAVRITVAGYVLYRAYVVLFRHRLFGFWDKIPVRIKAAKPAEKIIKASSRDRTVVRKIEGDYIPEPQKKQEPVPVEVEDAVPEVLSDIDLGLNQDDNDIEVTEVYTPTADELYDLDDEYPAPDLDFSSGLTYEQLQQTIGYMSSPTKDEQLKVNAAETLITIRNTDIFNFIETEVSNADAIGSLFDECLDETGSVKLSLRAEAVAEAVRGFDIDKYV